MEVLNATYNETVCMSSHMTLFGGGFFIENTPTSFEFIKKLADFDDNITIYMTVLMTLLLYLVSLIVARWIDYKDVKECQSTGVITKTITFSYGSICYMILYKYI